jgi:hypothetical protein
VQEIVAIQPEYVTEPSVVNLKVKHPLLALEIMVPGLVVPE